MSPDPSVSVIVLQSREGPYVEECLGSIEGQTLPDAELVLVDNRDRSLSIGAGWNRGIARSRGRFVTVVGDDDFIHQDYLATLTRHMNGHDRAATYVAIFDERSELIGYLKGSGGEFWRRSSLEALGGFNEDIRDQVDTELVAWAAHNAEAMDLTHIIIPHYLYGKRLHPGDGDHISASREFYDMVKRNARERRILVYGIRGTPPINTDGWRHVPDA